MRQSGDRRLRSEREKLYNRVRQLEQEVATLENNIGFFSKSKGAESMIAEVKVKIEATKREIADIVAKIKMIDGQ
jgi:spore germination protein GerM